jgi:RAT1-interacting protein
LNFGFKDMVQRDESTPEHLDTLLDAISDLKSKADDQEKATADIVSRHI